MIEAVILLRGAEEDYLTAYLQYEAQGREDRFDKSLQAGLEQLRHFPASGRDLGSDIRRLVLTSVPYGIYYTYDSRRVYVAAILHLRMNPMRVTERLQKP